MIDKNNRNLKETDSNINARRLMFERVRSLWSEERGVWCVVDFEAWDMDNHVITEFGWSAVRWVDGEPVEHMGHLIDLLPRTVTIRIISCHKTEESVGVLSSSGSFY
jgi:hypothetical protein